MIKKLRVPLIMIGVSYSFGFLAWAFSKQVIEHTHSEVLTLAIDKAPAAVVGPDLIANLLTISALVISSCFVYICLPSDRLELRITTHVKDSFIDQLRDEEVFSEYCDKTDDDDLTSGDKLIRLFLSPRLAIGGWHRMQRKVIVDNFDEKFADKLDRFVDKHADAQWLILLTWALGIGMLWGFICLEIRFFGINKDFFSPLEFGCTLSMFLLNLSTVIAANMLAFGGRSVERKIRVKIGVCISDSQKKLKDLSLERRNQEMGKFQEKAAQVVASQGAQGGAGSDPNARGKGKQPRRLPANGS